MTAPSATTDVGDDFNSTTTSGQVGDVLEVPDDGQLGGTNSTALAAGGKTLRVRDVSVDNARTVVIAAPGSIGVGSSLELFLNINPCSLTSEDTLLVLDSANGTQLAGSFDEIVLLDSDGAPVPAVRQFDDGCDGMLYEEFVDDQSLRVLVRVQADIACDQGDNGGDGSVIECPGTMPSQSSMAESPPSDECEQLLYIFCLWHLILIGIGACFCCLLLVLCCACIIYAGSDDDDDDDDPKRRDKVTEMLKMTLGDTENQSPDLDAMLSARDAESKVESDNAATPSVGEYGAMHVPPSEATDYQSSQGIANVASRDVSTYDDIGDTLPVPQKQQEGVYANMPQSSVGAPSEASGAYGQLNLQPGGELQETGDGELVQLGQYQDFVPEQRIDDENVPTWDDGMNADGQPQQVYDEEQWGPQMQW